MPLMDWGYEQASQLCRVDEKGPFVRVHFGNRSPSVRVHRHFNKIHILYSSGWFPSAVRQAVSRHEQKEKEKKRRTNHRGNQRQFSCQLLSAIASGMQTLGYSRVWTSFTAGDAASKPQPR